MNASHRIQMSLSTNGADLFFRSAVKDATAERFNQVTDAIAVLSFQPGDILRLRYALRWERDESVV